MVKVGKYDYEKSTRKDKKLMTIVKGKIIHFGNSSYQHYRDKTGIWSNLDHNDKKRRENYLARAKGIKDKSGNLTYKDPSSPNYHAVNVIW